MGSVLWCLAFFLFSTLLHESLGFKTNVDLTSGINLSWELQASGTIVFTLTADRGGWFGIGWHKNDGSDSGMTNADFTIITFPNKTLLVEDCFSNSGSNGYDIPVSDISINGTNDIINFSGMRTQNPVTSVISWQKKLNTGDHADWPILKGKTNVIFAFGDGDNIDYHGPNRGQILLDLFSGAVSSNNWVNVLRAWHASLMTIAFAFCMTFGIFVSRYIKNYYWWFPLHIAVMLLGLSFAGTAFIISLVMVQGRHFQSIHSIFGITTLSFAAVTPFLGLLAHYTWNPDRNKVPIWPDMIHWLFGRLTVVLAFVSIILGMTLLGLPYAVPVTFGILIGTFFIILGLVEVYSRFSSNGYETINKH